MHWWPLSNSRTFLLPKRNPPHVTGRCPYPGPPASPRQPLVRFLLCDLPRLDSRAFAAASSHWQPRCRAACSCWPLINRGKFASLGSRLAFWCTKNKLLLSSNATFPQVWGGQQVPLEHGSNERRVSQRERSSAGSSSPLAMLLKPKRRARVEPQ